MAYYPKYTGSSVSIVNALTDIGVNSSYDHRKKIAAANNISNYTGTAQQNTQMLNLLKQGLLIKPDGSTITTTTTTTATEPQAITDTPKVVSVFTNPQTTSAPTQETSATPNTTTTTVKNNNSINSKTRKSMFDNLTDKQKNALKIGAVVAGVGLVGYGVYKATRKSSSSSVSGGSRKAKAALNGVSHRKKRKSTKRRKTARRTRKVNLV